MDISLFRKSLASKQGLLKEARIGIYATSDIYAKNRKDVVIKFRKSISVESKEELAKLLKVNVKDLFATPEHEKLFDSLAAKGRLIYVYTDPYDFDINNTASLGVADSKSKAEKQEDDSAGDI